MKMLCITLASTLLLAAVIGAGRVSILKVVTAHGVFRLAPVKCPTRRSGGLYSASKTAART